MFFHSFIAMECVVYIVFFTVMYRANRSFNIPPPRANAEHLTPLPSRGGGNLIISLPGSGEFDPHALGVGNVNCTFDFM